jgi:hypothetical protein
MAFRIFAKGKINRPLVRHDAFAAAAAAVGRLASAKINHFSESLSLAHTHA